MESISPVSNQVTQPTTTTTTTSSSDRSRRKRRKKSQPSSSVDSSQSTSLDKWRSEKQQQIYSTKLVRALRELRISQQPSSSSSNPRGGGGRAVREVADRALAVAARGKTLWSRAILSKAVKLKFRKHKRQRISSPTTTTTTLTTGSIRSKKQRATVLRLKAKGLPAVQRKVKVLSRLVPGCRKQTLPVVLEETTDYIAAMEMQIRAMTAILSAVTSPPPPGHDGGHTHMLG
ncbi:PREDICTED: transcription factor bHLH147-like [Camelina sativa]|uniref:Transcription factor bHLH147-like n=1 Tax=Camelina sativa TaxID=90675 RepID=A0ABM0YRU9_CAMSA|nr:PREDICTED: transcription factor bHLH147-like [Camelina sativa]XP_010504978.1 PREDICTED: transcription factor bHLH147-like [Camelina sativa]XP_010504986.1 PREDICTED: transcription factor bHLH147-like [Camelina sativa]